ncbi:MAG: hypothetical protein GY910_18145 [bacterium]|nr:hypothetical protein [Deltaproteobacteria bacterium]MCP4906898.1 hypothetical protein [bacterium]
MSETPKNASQDSRAEDLLKALQAFEGTSGGAPGTCPYPINIAMIHHWCDAMGDRNPAYLDAEFASTTERGGVIAPPVMLQAWTMRGLRPSTAEEKAHAASASDDKSVMQLLDEAGFTSVVATNCEQEYLRDLVPGDDLTHEVELESVSPEKKTGLGVGHFVTSLYSFRDARGEIVGTMRFRILKFRPPAASDPSAKSKRDTGEKEPVIGPRIAGGRPRPSLNQDVTFFWEGASEGKLLVQRCTDCENLRHPPGPGCPACSSMEWEPVEMSGKGEIYSFVRHHHPHIPPFEIGHPVILVQLDEGPRLISELAEGPDAEIEIGMRVEVQFDELEERLTLPRFRIVDA